jgi:peroxiredoxin
MSGIRSRIRGLFWKAFIRIRWWFRFSGKRGREVGERIPDFTLSDLRGRLVRLSDAFPEKGVLLWLTNLCPSCEERIDLLQRVYKESRDRIEVLAISTLGEDRETPARIVRSHPIDFPLLLDPDDWLGRVLGFEHPGNACPLYNLLILDRFGKIRFKSHLSAIGDAKLIEALRSIEGTAGSSTKEGA